jgi:type II restriction enzyme
MIRRMKARDNPNLFVLRYEKAALEVVELFAVPKSYFTPSLITRRAPLSASARRAGWVGCTIHLGGVPQTGRIAYVMNGAALEREAVLEAWKRAAFMAEAGSLHARSWLVTVLRCVEALGREEFSLPDIYAFEDEIRKLFPDNQHVREKLRQQLQVLRDNGHLQFLGRGKYRRM